MLFQKYHSIFHKIANIDKHFANGYFQLRAALVFFFVFKKEKTEFNGNKE